MRRRGRIPCHHHRPRKEHQTHRSNHKKPTTSRIPLTVPAFPVLEVGSNKSCHFHWVVPLAFGGVPLRPSPHVILWFFRRLYPITHSTTPVLKEKVSFYP